MDDEIRVKYKSRGWQGVICIGSMMYFSSLHHSFAVHCHAAVTKNQCSKQRQCQLKHYLYSGL